MTHLTHSWLNSPHTSIQWPSEDALPETVKSATDMIQDYHRLHSGVNTPVNGTRPQQWFSEPPSLQIYDNDIVDVFLNLATTCLSPTFRLFENFAISTNTRDELYLAMAAVGGLFSQVPGSFRVAKAMFHDARRLLLASVGIQRPRPLRSLSDIRTIAMPRGIFRLRAQHEL